MTVSRDLSRPAVSAERGLHAGKPAAQAPGSRVSAGTHPPPEDAPGRAASGPRRFGRAQTRTRRRRAVTGPLRSECARGDVAGAPERPAWSSSPCSALELRLSHRRPRGGALHLQGTLCLSRLPPCTPPAPVRSESLSVVLSCHQPHAPHATKSVQRAGLRDSVPGTIWEKVLQWLSWTKLPNRVRAPRLRSEEGAGVMCALSRKVELMLAGEALVTLSVHWRRRGGDRLFHVAGPPTGLAGTVRA